MGDTTDTNNDALQRAKSAGLTPNAAMDAKAKAVLTNMLASTQPAPDTALADAQREAARLRVIGIHIGCFLLLVVAIVLKVTLLKSVPPIVIAGTPVDLGTLLIMAALWVWGQFGFPGSGSVLALKLAKLEPAALNQLLSLRPPAAGNALSVAPPPPSAAAPTQTNVTRVVTPSEPNP